MEDKLIKEMLHTATHNVVVKTVKEGDLFLNYDSVKVLDKNSKEHFVTYCPYEFEGNDLDKRTRNRINKIFINKYSYKDIIDIYEDMEKDKINRAIRAENTKHILESLIDDISVLKNYGDIKLLANHNTIEYYINFKRNYNISLEVTLSDKEDIFNVRYNYDKSIMNKKDLMLLVDDIVNISESEIEEENRKKEEEKRIKDIYNKRLEFARNIQNGKIAIVKLKSGYQCIERNKRYSVGDGKSGKFYKLSGISAIVDYLEKKDINKYIFIDEDNTYRLTNKILKSFNYSDIA